jgi:hypothetical protein
MLSVGRLALSARDGFTDSKNALPGFSRQGALN